MTRAYQAPYRAKETGHDHWKWANVGQLSTSSDPREVVREYLAHPVMGDWIGGVALRLGLLDQHVPHEQIVVDLLGAVQREVGERWHRNELRFVHEHLANGVATAALDALAGETSHVDVTGPTVVTCAEGD